MGLPKRFLCWLKHTRPIIADVVHESTYGSDLVGAGMRRSSQRQQVIRMGVGV